MLKTSLKILFTLVLLYGAGRFYVVYTDSQLSGNRAPYIQMLSTDSVIIHWLSEDEEASVVRYGKDEAMLDQIVIDEAEVKNHIVKLSQLEPGTRYFYRTGDPYKGDSADTAQQWFFTHPEGDVPTRIWVIGDSGEAGETVQQVRDAALHGMRKNPKPEPAVDAQQPAFSPLIDIWIALGDIAYRSGSNEQFQWALFDTFGELTGNTALWPVYGNHDDRRWTYFRIFDLPENGEAGGLASYTENYYAIDYSNVHFVILDSQASSLSATGAMAEWLREDLAYNTRPWVIAAFHHPPYSKGTHDSDEESDSSGRMQKMRENFLPILEKYGVDLVLSGHSHMYERSYLIDCAYQDSAEFSEANIVSNGVEGNNRNYIKPLNKKAHQGAIYAVAGSSSKVDKGPLDHPAHYTGLLEAGSMVIDVSGNKLVARFINSTGEVRDSFSITKQAGYDSGYQGCK